MSGQYVGYSYREPLLVVYLKFSSYWASCIVFANAGNLTLPVSGFRFPHL